MARLSRFKIAVLFIVLTVVPVAIGLGMFMFKQQAHEELVVLSSAIEEQQKEQVMQIKTMRQQEETLRDAEEMYAQMVQEAQKKMVTEDRPRVTATPPESTAPRKSIEEKEYEELSEQLSHFEMRAPASAPETSEVVSMMVPVAVEPKYTLESIMGFIGALNSIILGWYVVLTKRKEEN